MARASWKFHPFKDYEVEQYINYITDNHVDLIESNNKRINTIHKLNYFIPVSLHTGKWLIEKNLTKYHFSFKLGQFTKNRKPFYFRSKKKKNVKKNYLSKQVNNATSTYFN